MTKIEQLKALVEANGTEKMKELVIITENYLPGLNRMFRWRGVSQDMLKEFDFPMFLKELQDEGIFNNRSGMEIKLLVMNIYYIARHTWEFIDENKIKKTGDDLHKAWSTMFEDKEMMTVEQLYRLLQYM